MKKVEYADKNMFMIRAVPDRTKRFPQPVPRGGGKFGRSLSRRSGDPAALRREGPVSLSSRPSGEPARAEKKGRISEADVEKKDKMH